MTDVISFLSNLGENEQLSLKLLTQTLAVLMALVLAHRSSGLVRLSLLGKKVTPEGVVLPLTGLAKQSKPGSENSLQPVTIPRFVRDKRLCPVEYLQAYVLATAQFRMSQDHQQLFISHQAPHKPVQSSTIARWIKQILEMSGVDSNTFSAHSTRGAASTAAVMRGMSTTQVMARAGWSSKDTFCQHYY